MLTKSGKEIVEKTKDNAAELQERGLRVLHGGETLAGGGLLRNSLTSGDLTGRATLWHGTDAESAAKIKHDGLQATSNENAINTARLQGDPERYQKSLGKSYTTKNPIEARMYAMQTASGKRAGWWGKTVKINAPVWEMKTLVNPEVDMPYEEWNKRLGLAARLHPERAKKNMYKRMRDNVVFDGNVPGDYIVGNPKYKANSLGEIGKYIKANPKSFLRGLGKGALGIAGLAHGGYKLYYDMKSQN